MNYEQKYKEALGWMQSLYNGLHGATKEDAEHYFPELKESEDERIRKAIICGMYALKDQHRTCFASIPIDNAIAWLEKQGESTDINPSEFDLRLNKLLKQFETLSKEELASSLSFYLNVVQNDGTYKAEEKQGEKKHVEWHREDEQNLNACLGYIPDEFLRRWLMDVIHVKYDKPADKVEDEEYNGEDYGIDSLYHAQRILEKTLGKVNGYQTDDGILEHQCAITAVKKLYEQKTSKWSEEDEKIILSIEQVMNCASLLNIVPEKIDKIKSWLKSLKKRYTWKPSDEQLEALKNAIQIKPFENPSDSILWGLYEQLKKL